LNYCDDTKSAAKAATEPAAIEQGAGLETRFVKLWDAQRADNGPMRRGRGSREAQERGVLETCRRDLDQGEFE
jgi:hypothetical protein